MLNSNDEVVRKTAEKSLKLHMEKRKIKETDLGNNFAGYEIDKQGLVVKNTRICLSKSYWIEINSICSKLDINIIKTNDGLYAIKYQNNVVICHKKSISTCY